MATLVPAAVQLLDQVADIRELIKVTHGEPDGLGFVREITLDAKTSRWLAPLLDVIGDQRIKSVTVSGRGRATIEFVPDYRADFKDPFPLDEVDAILND